MNRIAKPRILLIAVSILAVALMGCAARESAQEPATTIVFGGVYPLTGALSAFGQAAKDGLASGAEYANKNILASSPFKLEPAVEDSRGEPATGLLAYRRLVSGKKARICNVILSNVAITLKPVADQDGVLLFADSTHSSLTGGTTLRHSQTADQEAAFILDHCRSMLGAKSLVAVVADDDYGESFLKALGQEVTALRYAAKASDLKPIATQAASTKSDAIIVVGVGGPLGEIIRSIREAGYQGSIVSTVAFDVVPSTRQVAGDAAKGVWYPQLVQDASKLGSPSSGESATASTIKVIAFNDAVFVAQALVAEKVNPADIRGYLLSQKIITGVGTTVVPQPNGTLLPQLKMIQMP